VPKEMTLKEVFVKSSASKFQKALERRGLLLIRNQVHRELLSELRIAQTKLKWTDMNEFPALGEYIRSEISHSNMVSQLQQDFVAKFFHSLKSNKPGFFVEFGASDGIVFSNSLLLEQKYSWTGIIAEPAKYWQDSLMKNRKCRIDFRCVWSESGKLIEFNETASAEYSTINHFSDSDLHEEIRRSGRKYSVETVSLKDLLDHHGAPNVISYLSVDTEGSEYEILEHFDFSEYSFNFISVEHNYGVNRDNLKALLEGNGYSQVLQSHSEFDDWFIHDSALLSFKKGGSIA
jgi:FkbM family methyltransferase